jgi:integrase/recombinase XerD
VDSLESKDSWIVVRGKGEKERAVPLHPKTREALLKVKKYRKSEVWVFPQVQRGRDEPLTRTGVYQMVKRWGRAAGIPPEKLSPHKLRHSFAK